MGIRALEGALPKGMAPTLINSQRCPTRTWFNWLMFCGRGPGQRRQPANTDCGTSAWPGFPTDVSWMRIATYDRLPGLNDTGLRFTPLPLVWRLTMERMWAQELQAILEGSLALPCTCLVNQSLSRPSPKRAPGLLATIQATCEQVKCRQKAIKPPIRRRWLPSRRFVAERAGRVHPGAP